MSSGGDPYGIGATAQGISSGLTAHFQSKASAQQAEAARSWAKKMRATAYQTAVVDLEKAGLNPLLAFGAGHVGSAGAPNVPAAAPVYAPDFSFLGSAFGKALTGAKQLKAMRDELRGIKAGADTAEAGAEFAKNKQISELNVLESQADKNYREAYLASLQAGESSARTANINVMRKLAETDLPAAQARMRLDESEFGERLQQFRRTLEALPVFGGSIRSGSIRSR